MPLCISKYAVIMTANQCRNLMCCCRGYDAVTLGCHSMDNGLCQCFLGCYWEKLPQSCLPWQPWCLALIAPALVQSLCGIARTGLGHDGRWAIHPLPMQCPNMIGPPTPLRCRLKLLQNTFWIRHLLLINAKMFSYDIFIELKGRKAFLGLQWLYKPRLTLQRTSREPHTFRTRSLTFSMTVAILATSLWLLKPSSCSKVYTAFSIS